LGLLFFAVIIAVVWGAAKLLNPSGALDPPRVENPNANNPDALEADLDPEGDEPQGY
jgi:hypothetical protein